MPHQPLLDLVAALRDRAPHETTDSWLYADVDGLAAVAVAALRADPAIAARWANGGQLRVPAVGDFHVTPAFALAEVARVADLDGADQITDARLVDDFLAYLRLDDDRVELQVTATFIGPALVDAERLATSAGILARAQPADLSRTAAASGDQTNAITYSFIVSAPATSTVAVPAPRDRSGLRVDSLIAKHLLRLQLALALVGDGPVQEHLVMVRPRFSPAGAGVPLAHAGPIVATAAYPLPTTLVNGDLDAWLRRVRTMDLRPMAVAIRRLLLARTERARTSDQLVDFAVAFEALTGKTSAKIRGPLIRSWLDADAEGAHRRVADARNEVLHDGAEPPNGAKLVADGEKLLRALLIKGVEMGGTLREPPPVPAGEFEPTIRPMRELPAQVVAGRAEYDAWAAETFESARAPVEAHLLALAELVDRIEHDHAQLAERADFDLAADTRWTATWLMAGRSISLAHSLLVLLRGGNGAGALPVARAMHEANRLLDAFTDREETALLARWLANESIEPREIRAAVGRMFDRERRQLEELGVDLGNEIDPTQHSAEIYRVLSRRRCTCR